MPMRTGAGHHHNDSEGLPADVFQSFTSRDRRLLAGLARRPEIVASPDLSSEVATMASREVKVEVEALCVQPPCAGPAPMR